ncbi:MAG: surface glycan-binding family protein [Phocaeicola sp.]
MKDRFYSKTIGCIIAMLAIVLGISSCKDDFTTDDGSFALYYTSMTDIGPSMTGVIASPTYKGAVPSDFKIVEVNYSSVGEDGKETRETYTGECFSIVSETGEIMINSTADMKTGKYYISVSCVAAGNTYTYKDAVEVNFLKAVPEGITVEPDFLEVKLADVTDKDSEAAFPTAQVSTENTDECISILGYKISNVRRVASDDSETYIDNSKVKLFSVSETGVVSINKSSDYDAETVKAGIYKIDLKLTTAASPNLPEEEGLFVNALTVNFTAAPTAISYKDGFIETGVEGDDSKPRGGFTSSKPLVTGSTNGATYEIAAIKKSSGGTLNFTDAPETEKAFFTIDNATGIISVPDTHTFVLNDVYKLSVKVTNPDGNCTGEDALTLTVVDWVDPLTAFGYPALSVKQGMNCVSGEPEISDKKGVEFSLVDLAEEYEEYVSINKSTGVVTIEKYNTMPVGNLEVAVKAKNFKGEATGKLVIEVQDNPNYFTYISFGNNLVDEQTPGSIYDNQYRFRTLKELNQINLTPTTDVKEGQAIVWKIVGKHQYKGTDKNDFIAWDNDAKITANMNQDTWDNVEYTLTVLLVSATVGSGEEAFTRTVPLCFNYVKPQDGTAVLYTPFVFRVNPKYGGRSVVPVIENQGSFVMDYRRNFNYYNINGVKSDGTPLKEGSPSGNVTPTVVCFLTDLWQSVANSTNFGARLPFSYWVESNKGTLKDPVTLSENTLAYVDNTVGANQFSVVVTKNFYDDGWGDGIVTGQMTFVTDGNVKGVSNGKKTFPLAIWLDKSYVLK